MKPFFPSACHHPASCRRSSDPACRLLLQQLQLPPSPLYHHGPAPSSEPLLQALRDGCSGLARKCIQVLTNPRRRGHEPGEQTPRGSFLCPCRGRVSPWTFCLARLIICKKGILELAWPSQPDTSRTDASTWEVVLKGLSPSCSFPTPACLIHHRKTVPSRKKPSQVTYRLKRPPLTSYCFQAEI